MADATQKAITGGVSLVVVAILAIVGTQMVTQSALTEEFAINSETEWNNYQSTIDTGLEVTTDGFLQFTDSTTETTGVYTASLDTNESDANQYTVLANIPDSDNSSVTVSKGGTTYNVEDGTNRLDVGTGSTFDVTLNRDSDTVSSPQVDSVQGFSGDTGLLGLISGLAFGLLMLLSLFKVMNVSGIGRNTRM